MPNINISDSDLTTATSTINNTYAVYIPGLSVVPNAPAKPTEYTSLAAFKAAIGDVPYLNIVADAGRTVPDKSYIYACELLGAGLPVVYQVLNVDDTIVASAKVTSWTASGNQYNKALTAVGFDSSKYPTIKVAFDDNTYSLSLLCAKIGSGAMYYSYGAQFAVVSTEPADWASAYANYYIRTGSGTSTDPFVYTANASSTWTDTNTYCSQEFALTTDEPMNVKFTDATHATITIGDNNSHTVAIMAIPSTLSVANIQSALATTLGTSIEAIEDRGAFNVSFITSGGYASVSATTNFADALVATAANRGDAFALIDLDESIKINKMSDLPSGVTIPANQDAFIITPWIETTASYSNYAQPITMPGSFAYLKAFASSIRTNNSWFSIAGVRRGAVAAAGVTNVITNAEADALQPELGQSINSITYIRPYGFTIWGNRTLLMNSGLTANSFINVRQLVHDIKRNLYITARSLMFEPNDDILWVNFKNQITPLLDRMRSGQGISSYRLVKVENNARATLTARVIIAPIEAVENFILTVELVDEDVTVTE